MVTPHVQSIAKGLFYRTLVSSGQSLDDPNDDLNDSRDVCVSENPFVVHYNTPDTIRWGEQFPGQYSYYKSVIIDDVVYHVSTQLTSAMPRIKLKGSFEGGRRCCRRAR